MRWEARVEGTFDGDPGEVFDALPAGATVTQEGADVTVRLGLDASTLRQAVNQALAAVRHAGVGRVETAHVTTTERAAAEAETPAAWDLMGVAEIAAALGVTRQRAGQVTGRPDFPAPVIRLASGPAWTRAAVEEFEGRWARRRTGRPRLTA